MRLRRLAGLAPLVAVAVTWIASLIAQYDVVADVDPARAGCAPAPDRLLGCDHLGRDVLWRAVTASESFVGPGLVAALAALAAGVPAGAAAGWAGGGAADALRYVFAVVSALPRFVLVLLACAVYGAEPAVLAVAAGLSYAPSLGEAVYARVAALRADELADAAQAHGLSTARILLFHLLWVGCRRLIGRHLLYLFVYVLVLETTLSYIGGFGIEEPQPSWGNMLAFEFGQSGGNPLAWLAPALALWLAVLGATLAAEGLEERVG